MKMCIKRCNQNNFHHKFKRKRPLPQNQLNMPIGAFERGIEHSLQKSVQDSHRDQRENHANETRWIFMTLENGNDTNS